MTEPGKNGPVIQPRTGASRWRRGRWIIFLAAFVGAVLADQVTKRLVEWYVPPETSYSLVGDTLAIFYLPSDGTTRTLGLPTDRTVVAFVGLVALTVIVCLAVSNWRSGEQVHPINQLGRGLLLGGLLSNGGDLHLRGSVVDWLALPNGWVINIADVCISVGAALWLGYLFAALLIDLPRPNKPMHGSGEADRFTN
jgi:signal peptidase II